MDDDPALVDAATSTMSLLMLGGAALGLGALVLRRYRRKAVSYTHLTLPTICSV